MKESLEGLFKSFHLDHVKIDAGLASAQFSFQEEDKDAAWDLYVEMLTRITTQHLPTKSGNEQAALDSIYSLFPITREILHRRGRRTIRFTKVAIPILNQLIRPFTTKWHQKSLSKGFDDPLTCREFRKELADLLIHMRNYNRMLAKIAKVEDLTDLEQKEEKS